MTNNEKIQRAEQLMAEAKALLNEVKTIHDNEEDVIAKYKNDYTKGRQYYLNSQSKVDFISVGNSFEKVEIFTQYPYQHYLTEELAEQAKRLKDFNDKLLAFKYCYDLDYKPNWDDHVGNKYFVCYKHTDEESKYIVDYHYVTQAESMVYFSTKEIAQKCADWLNSLKEV